MDAGIRPAGPVPEDASPANPPESSPAAPPAGEATEQDVQDDLGALLAEAEAKRDEYLDLARRAQADFENYRKRMAAEVQAAALRGKAEVARGMIDAVDNLERALQPAGIDPDANDPLEGGNTAEVKNPEGLAHGVLLVFFGMRETLRRNGIEVV